ncbi:MAG: hypothetical protein ACR2KT_04660 [Methylocella sp.]
MDFKHSFVFLGKGEAQGQSKTARSCEQHLAILPRAFGLHHRLARRPDAATLPEFEPSKAWPYNYTAFGYLYAFWRSCAPKLLSRAKRSV